MQDIRANSLKAKAVAKVYQLKGLGHSLPSRVQRSSCPSTSSFARGCLPPTLGLPERGGEGRDEGRGGTEGGREGEGEGGMEGQREGEGGREERRDRTQRIRAECIKDEELPTSSHSQQVR